MRPRLRRRRCTTTVAGRASHWCHDPPRLVLAPILIALIGLGLRSAGSSLALRCLDCPTSVESRGSAFFAATGAPGVSPIVLALKTEDGRSPLHRDHIAALTGSCAASRPTRVERVDSVVSIDPRLLPPSIGDLRRPEHDVGEIQRNAGQRAQRHHRRARDQRRYGQTDGRSSNSCAICGPPDQSAP